MRQQIQKFGRALSGMVMPNIGAFIAWGFVTALFIPSGWWPNTQMARLVDPMLTYLLPLLIAYTAGRNVAGERGGVIGAIAAMGVIVGSDIPMFIGVMVMGPLGGYTIRWFDKLTQGRIKAGFEMLVSNFSIGILGMLLAILGYWVIGGAVTGLTLLVSNGVEVVIRHGLLPLVSLLVEPSKVLFLNNALNHGIFSPIGIEQARETGQSIMFLLETNPGPGLGVLLACWFFGRGNTRQSAPGAVIIQFFGGIHEIYFPYILARPALILAPVAGSAAGLLFFSLAGAGLVAPASPGSIISVLAMAPKGQTLVVLAGVLISTAVSLLMAAPFVRRAAAAEDMPTGAIPAAQSGAPAVKAALHFPAHIRKVVFACDAGMGSSALGATRFRKRLSDAGIGTAVGNCAADGIPADADVVVCQSVLAGRIAGSAQGAALVVIDNFLADPALDVLFARLAQQDGADAIPRAGGLPAGTVDAQPSDAGLRRVGDAPDRMASPQPDDAAGRSPGEVLRPGNIRTGLSSEPKEAAIRRAGELLAAGGYVEPGYADAMLRREELATTYMGMGIAIPHGTSDAKKCVLHSGIVVLQYPGGVAFGDEKAYLVVGIAGVGDAHLDILARLGVYLGPGRTRRVNLPPGALGGRQDDGRVAPYAGDPVVDVCPDEIGVPEAVAARLVRHFDRRRVLYHRVALVDTGVEVRPAYRRRAPVEQAVQYLQHVRVHQRTVRTAVPHGGPDAQFAPEELVRVILPEGVAQFEIDTRRRARDVAFVHPHVRRVELVGVDDIELAPRHRHRGGAYRCNI